MTRRRAIPIDPYAMERPDGRNVVRSFIVWGAPRTKKNSSEIRYARPFCGVCRRGRPWIGPSTAWTEWLNVARIQFASVDGMIVPGDASHRIPPPVDVAVNAKAWFYRDKKSKGQGDAVGFYQGLADVLEKRGVVANDRLIVSWDGSRVFDDVDSPRVEVELERV